MRNIFKTKAPLLILCISSAVILYNSYKSDAVEDPYKSNPAENIQSLANSKKFEKGHMLPGEVRYDTLFSGTIGNLHVDLERVSKTLNERVDYNQISVTFPDGEKDFAGDFDLDGKVDYTSGSHLNWENANEIYQSALEIAARER